MDFLSFQPTRGACLTKVCGLRSELQARACGELGAHAIGINFWPGSKRYVDPATAGWLTGLPASLARVGVFVNAPTDVVRRLLDAGVIHAAQLHGDETPAECARLRENGYKILKAFGLRDETSLEPLPDFDVDAVVLDAFCPGAYGGSGKTFSWPLALKARELLPSRPIVLSGGLNPDNVAEAARQVRPYAVDVASGVERAPGEKDLALVAAFLRAVG